MESISTATHRHHITHTYFTHENFRYRKTENEARTLEAVKLELNKVDNLVMKDVSLLREKIEEANRQYTAARLWGYIY